METGSQGCRLGRCPFGSCSFPFQLSFLSCNLELTVGSGRFCFSFTCCRLASLVLLTVLLEGTLGVWPALQLVQLHHLLPSREDGFLKEKGTCFQCMPLWLG